MSKFLALSLIIISLIAGIGIGYILSPQYTLMDKEKNMQMDLGSYDRNFDLRYINAMIAHHRQAMLLAEQAQERSQRQEVEELADEILSAEPAAIEELYKYKEEMYNDSSRVADPQVPNLGPAGPDFDLRLLNALIAHHEEGIEMADTAIYNSTRAEVLDNAYKVKDFLEEGVSMLSAWRNIWYPLD